ncbi:BPL-N domain-containing protein [Bdellovibrionota bacterium FG-2]
MQRTNLTRLTILTLTTILGFGLGACNAPPPLITPTVSVPQTQDSSTKTTPESETAPPPETVPAPEPTATTTPTTNPTPTATPTPTPTVSPSPSPTPSPKPPSNQGRLAPYTTGALVFGGDGVWTGEMAKIEQILDDHFISYREFTTTQLNALSVDDIAQYGMIVWPGGSGTSEVATLTTQIKANLKTAVQDRGVSFIGFCAGAFIGVSPLGLISHSILDYYFLENQGVSSAMVLTAWADGSTHDLVWYGGPVTPDGAGAVIAKYPDGNPAISQIWGKRGLVILSGPHPAAPDSTRTSMGDSDGSDDDAAWELMNATLEQIPLTAY